MSDEIREAVSALESRLAAQQREIDDLRAAAAARPWPRVRMTSTPRRLAIGTVIALALAATPVIASHQFSDVPSSSGFHADISAIAAVGVTTGCAAGRYCPKDFVTREQMAAFLNRLGALGAGKTPVVNATKLDGIDSTGFLKAGAIVVHQLGPWERWQFSDATTVGRTFHETLVTSAVSPGSGGIVMTVNMPASVAGKAYGFQSAKVCYSSVTVDAALIGAYITQSNDSGALVFEIADETERDLASAACLTLTDPTPTAATGATTVRLHTSWNDPGTVFKVRSTRITWVPIG